MPITFAASAHSLRRMCMSAWLMPNALISLATWPALGSGSGGEAKGPLCRSIQRDVASGGDDGPRVEDLLQLREQAAVAGFHGRGRLRLRVDVSSHERDVEPVQGGDDVPLHRV